MNISLNNFIKNLDTLKKTPMNVFSEAIIEISYGVLWQMAKHTIIDTGQARAKLIRKFAETYNKPYDNLKETFYRYWETHGFPENVIRSWDNYNDTDIKDKTSKNSRSISVKIYDAGLYAQANAVGGIYNAKRYPSPVVTDKSGSPRDNGNFIPQHIDILTSMINNKEYSNFENINIDKIIDEVVKKINTHLFK